MDFESRLSWPEFDFAAVFRTFNKGHQPPPSSHVEWMQIAFLKDKWRSKRRGGQNKLTHMKNIALEMKLLKLFDPILTLGKMLTFSS